jgi:anti-anti-sigma regulatory factor
MMLTNPTADTADLGPDVELRLIGTIAGPSLPALAQELALALELRPENLILNARACTGMDPDAVRRLLDVCDDVRVTGSQIVVQHPTPTLVWSLAMAGVLRWLTVDYPDAAGTRGQQVPRLSGVDRGPLKTPLQQMAIRRLAGW